MNIKETIKTYQKTTGSDPVTTDVSRNLPHLVLPSSFRYMRAGILVFLPSDGHTAHKVCYRIASGRSLLFVFIVFIVKLIKGEQHNEEEGDVFA